MKKLLGIMGAFALAAAPALAIVPRLGSSYADPNALQLIDGVNASISFEEVAASSTGVERHAGNDMFRAMTGPFAGFAPGNALGYDDYFGASGFAGPGDPDGNSPLQEFGFYGGITTVGMSLQIQFYNANADFLDSFDVALPTALTPGFVQLWTITTGPDTHPPFSDPFFSIPNQGYVQIVGVTPTDTGNWFLSTSLPTVGSESRAPGQGSITSHSHRFRLDVPEPASMALLALGGLFAARRRK